MRIAAIDVGSTATRLLVCQVGEASGSFSAGLPGKVELDLRFPVCIGEGVTQSGRISPERATELAACFRKIRIMCTVRRVERLRAVATAAFRAAENGAEVVELVEKASGIRISAISPAEEARLSMLPLLRQGLAEPSGLLLVDVGGLSTDLCLTLPQTVEPQTWTFAVGTLRQPADEGYAEALQQFSQTIQAIFSENYALCFAATGGSIHHIGRLWGNEAGVLSLSSCKSCISQAAPLGISERQRRWNLSELRAETIVRAANIYQILLTAASRQTILAPLAGVRHGLLLSLCLNSEF